MADVRWRGVLNRGPGRSIVLLVMGPRAFTGLIATLPDTLANVDALEWTAERVHSLRSLTRLLPDALQMPVWIAAVGILLITVGLVALVSAQCACASGSPFLRAYW